MSPAILNSPEAAFLAGLATSLHCVGMCGPLACAIIPAGAAATGGWTHNPHLAHVLYHAARVASYVLVGALAGSIGALPVSFGLQAWTLVLPWVLVVFFLILALGGDRLFSPGAALGRRFGPLAARARRLPPAGAAAGLGALTPFLPCGPLYGVFALAVFTGTAARGAEFLAAFALGTVPLLWLAQNRYGWLHAHLGPRGFACARAVLALAAALILTWRLRSSFGLAGPDIHSFTCH